VNPPSPEELVVEEPESLADKLDAAKPGKPIVYHVGRSLRGCRDGKTALARYYRGEVALVQKRIADGLFAYAAIKRRQVIVPHVPLVLEDFVAKLLKEAGS
jgi:hypothetical protein